MNGFQCCLLLGALALTSAFTLPTKDCGSSPGKFVSLSLDPPPVGACTFPKGKNVTASVTFGLNEVTKKLNVICKGQVAGLWVPFKLPNPDACTQGVTCPSDSSKQYTFKTVIPILSEYPKIRLVVKMEFQDDDSKDAVCVEFPAEIC